MYIYIYIYICIYISISIYLSIDISLSRMLVYLPVGARLFKARLVKARSVPSNSGHKRSRDQVNTVSSRTENLDFQGVGLERPLNCEGWSS